MDDGYENVDGVKPDQATLSMTQTGDRSSHRTRHGAAAVTLGLLSVFMVVGLVVLGLLYHNLVQTAAAEMSAIKANLTSVTEQRDRMSISLTEMKEQRDRMLRLSREEKTCPEGWTMFGCSCYRVSAQSGSWTRGRAECRSRGADLVVIDSAEEQTFLTKLTKQETWIGLTDQEEERTWKWVDGSPLAVTFWTHQQPDNGNGDPEYGEEDCAHMNRCDGSDKWNDRSCKYSIQWICEKDLHSPDGQSAS